MNKANGDGTKKVIVRNTQRSILPAKIGTIKDCKKTTQVKKTDPVRKKTEKDTTSLEYPGTNSVLKIQKEINRVEKIKLLEIEKDKATANDKMTRKVNFPADYAIFKDLIPLDIPTRPLTLRPTREPRGTSQRDEEPKLSMFIKPKTRKEYMSRPTVKYDAEFIMEPVNSLRLYQVIQANET